MTAKYAKDAKYLSQSLRPSVFLDYPVTQSSQRLWNQLNSWVLNGLISDHRITRSPGHPIARPGHRFPWTAIFFLCVALTTTGCWKQPSHFNWKNAPGAGHYENLMWQAVREKDWMEVQQHLSPAFVGVTADGR